jgi:hypothetical protein
MRRWSSSVVETARDTHREGASAWCGHYTGEASFGMASSGHGHHWEEPCAVGDTC